MCAPTEKDKFTEGLNLAWRHFELHAKQRTTIINFYFLVMGLIITAIFSAIDKVIPIVIALPFSILSIFVAYAFHKLQQRNADLLGLSEDVMRSYERKYKYFSGLEEATTLPFADDRDGAEQNLTIPLGIFHTEQKYKRAGEILAANKQLRDEIPEPLLIKIDRYSVKRNSHGTWYPRILRYITVIILLFLGAITLAYSLAPKWFCAQAATDYCENRYPADDAKMGADKTFYRNL